MSDNILASAETTHIYVLKDPRDGRIRYVGKADEPARRYKMHLCENKPTYKCRWVWSLRRLGLTPQLSVLETIPKLGWQEREKWWISTLREQGFDLTNTTDGGDGTSGYHPSPEERYQSSIRQRGRVFSEETIQRMKEGAARRDPETRRASIEAARNMSPETRRKISEAAKGRKYVYSEARGRSISLRQRGRVQSPETRRKVGDANRGRVRSEEVRQRMGEAHRGKPAVTHHKRTGTTSQFKGVSYDPVTRKWKGALRVAGKSVHLGYFAREIDAASAYNDAAAKYHGERAWINDLAHPGEIIPVSEAAPMDHVCNGQMRLFDEEEP